MRDPRLPLLLALLTAACPSLACRRTPSLERDHYNVVLLGFDTLRPDALGCLGAKGDPTPAIDRLAEEGLLAVATSAAPWTLPSFASLLTGLDPEAHGVWTRDDRLPAAVVTLAEVLSEAGYDTAAFTCGGHVSRRNGLQDGFAIFDARSRTKKLAERVPAALAWLDARHSQRPFFLFLHGYDVHAPYTPRRRPRSPAGYRPPDATEVDDILAALDDPRRARDLDPGRVLVASRTVAHPRAAELRRRVYAWSAGLDPSAEERWISSPDFEAGLEWMRSLYLAEARELDAAVADLVRGLRDRRLLDDTLIVLVSDHGEEFMEHGGLDHLHVHPEVTAVPLAFRFPPAAGGPTAVRLDAPVSTLDVVPTVLDTLGLPPPRDLQGLSLLRALGRPGRLADRDLLCYQHNVGGDTPEVALVRGRWRLRVDGPHHGAVELFDTIADPGCRNDVSGGHPEIVRSLLARLADARAASRALRLALGGAGRAVSPDRRERRELEQLGYVAPQRKQGR